MMLLGIGQRKIVMAVMAGVEVEHLDAVQIFRRSGGAFLAERVCLHEQCGVCAVLRGKGRQTLAHDAIRIGQQGIVKAVQQVIVVRFVKTQFSTRIHADIVFFGHFFQPVIALQEGLRFTAGGGQINFGIVEAFAVVVVGDADRVIAARGIILHNGLCAKPAAAGDVGGMQMGFNAVHKILLLVYENAAESCGILNQQRCG